MEVEAQKKKFSKIKPYKIASNNFIVQIFNNKSILAQMIFRDFKAKYAGTVLGIIWAILQPAITVTIYVVVFSMGFKSAPVSGTPYFLWLVSAMVPWLFFNDIIVGVSSSLNEYSYLIKKTVFPSQLLPLVKAGSAVIAHTFFVILSMIAFVVFGQKLNIFAVQIIYYSFCTLMYGLGVGLIACSLMPFFKDIAQIISVMLQLSFWATPIAWNIEILPENIRKVFELNPLLYCVSGFRESFIGGVWAAQKPQTIYFIVFVAAIWVVGLFLFIKLKKNYADLL